LHTVSDVFKSTRRAVPVILFSYYGTIKVMK